MVTLALKRVYGQPVKVSEGVCVNYINWICKGCFYIGLKQRQKGGKAGGSNICTEIQMSTQLL